ncbi:MAG: SRPBCC family protein [Rhodococcus sp. (in: high G+C Gram-positive bacteria)]|nr:SRPBCC family protein [Rhodococcus sp. (in: high G+C Gram-positive bacteria)]
MNHDPLVSSRHVSQVIRRTPADVYEFAADPANLPKWAAGLANSPVSVDGDRLIAESPMGRVAVRFVPHNDLGVLDHDVTLPSGTTVNNPVRVLNHPNGAEVLFTVRQIELTDEEFERDLGMVAEDLKRLKDVLEP